MASANINNVFQLICEGAEANGLPIEKFVKAVQWHNAKTATERSDNEAREAARPQIVSLFEANPNADLDPREIATRVGLKNCQADRSFVRHQLKQARLTWQGGQQQMAAD